MPRVWQGTLRHINGSEAAVVGLNRVKQILSKVNLAFLQHCQILESNRLEQSYLDIGIALRVARQKLRKHAFDVLR